MKKTFAFLLALIMVLSVGLIGVSAVETKPFKVQSTGVEYDTLHEAVESLTTDEDTIILQCNYDATGEQNKYALEHGFTLEGGNFTITGGAYLWFLAAPRGETITIQNVKINSTHGFRVRTTGQNVVAKNVTATLRTGLFMNLQYQTTPAENTDYQQTVTLEGCTITSTSAHGEPLLATYSASNWTVNLNGTKLIKPTDSKHSKDAPGNNAVIYFFQGTKIVLNVDATSVISSARQTGSKIVSCLCIYKGADVTINLKSGSKLCLADESENKYTFIEGVAKVVDEGCTYVISANVARRGVTLPSVTFADENLTLLGFSKVGGGLVSSGYKNEEADAEESFVAVTYNAGGFFLEDGASIRTADPYGIRFTAQISAELYETLKAIDPNLEIGMYIAPTNKVFGGFNVNEMLANDYVKVVNEKWAAEDTDGFNVFRVAMYGIPTTKAAFKTALSAMAYITIHLEDGSTQTIYTTYLKEDNSRSLYDVAKDAYEDGVTDSSVINNIITVSEAN